jgi:hypothetical protein
MLQGEAVDPVATADKRDNLNRKVLFLELTWMVKYSIDHHST